MHKKLFNSNKFIALLLFICMTLTLLFSIFYIISYANHDCIGAHCTICEHIKICTTIIEKLGAGLDAFSLDDAFCVAFLLYIFIKTNRSEIKETLVKLKVRLNN